MDGSGKIKKYLIRATVPIPYDFDLWRKNLRQNIRAEQGVSEAREREDQAVFLQLFKLLSLETSIVECVS